MDAKNKRYQSRYVKPKVRDENMIFGIRAIIEAIRAGRDLEKVFIQKNLKGDLAKDLWGELQNTLTPISKVPIQKLDGFTRKNHQGAVAFVSPVKYYTIEGLVQRLYEEGRAPFIVLLDGVTDVRNFGAFARTAECMGADGLIIPIRNSVQVNSDAVKTSSGALNHLPVCRVESLEEAISYLSESGLKSVACTEKSDKRMDELDLRDPIVMVMGSEDVGISDEVLDKCDLKAGIPLFGKVQSLNVSVAAGMFMYEANRQRG